MTRRPKLPSQILKRSVAVDRHKTSISLEAAFWSALREVAALERLSIPQLVSRIDTDGQHVKRILISQAICVGPLLPARGGKNEAMIRRPKLASQNVKRLVVVGARKTSVGFLAGHEGNCGTARRASLQAHY